MKKNVHFFFVFFVLPIAVKAQNFTVKPTPDIVGVQYSSIDFADVDGDGDLDFFAAGANPGYELTSRLYKNDGSGNFTLSDENTFIKIREGAVAFGDVNGDNFPDLIISGSAPGPTTKLYINNGTGNFTLSAAVFTQNTFSALVFGDIDNDDDIDLIMTGFTGSESIIELYKNDGNGNFTQVSSAQSGITTSGLSRSSVIMEDFNNDGFLDIFATGSTTNNTIANALYINDGDGTFTVKTTPITPIQTGSVAAADYDNDGDNDLLIVGSTSVSAKVALLYNNDGNGNFTLVPDLPFIGAQYGKSVFADINNDNYPDVFISGYLNPNRRADMYVNNGASGGFTQVTVPFLGVNNCHVAFADVDGDNDLDFMATGQSEVGTISRLYLNDHSLGIDNPKTETIRFYPNPVTTTLQMEFVDAHPIKAEIYSITGQLVHAENFENGTNPVVHFDSLESGIYLMKVVTNSGAQVKRIAKL
ncbi:T9SS type A sorting domain-containing protein [Flavobacterium microcysteis]